MATNEYAPKFYMKNTTMNCIQIVWDNTIMYFEDIA